MHSYLKYVEDILVNIGLHRGHRASGWLRHSNCSWDEIWADCFGIFL